MITPSLEAVDLLVIGGGINGAGLARDAAGRGLKVLLCEKDDLAQGTSSRSGKYIHGGLRYLEFYEFRLVREALIEREVLLEAAPHIIWPMRLVLPHSPEQRPAWLIRLGLFLYDHLGGRKRLPATRVLDLATAPEAKPLRSGFRRAFEYADCWVDDARLVLLNALDAKRRGALVLPRTACVRARRADGLWHAVLKDSTNGEERTVAARAIVNTAGPWVEDVLGSVAGVNSRRRIRLVKGSHIVLKKWWHGGHGYVLQNADKRLIFVNPYQDGLTLIGTTDVPFHGRPEEVEIGADEVAYLLAVLGRYFDRDFAAEDVITSFSGVRPLFDDDADKSASAVTRDYVFDLDGGKDRAPILSAFGGKITTFRKLAEQGLERLRPYFPQMKPSWTRLDPLPGGDMADADFAAWLSTFQAAHPWLPPAVARHFGRLYGTMASDLLKDARSLADLGRHFGGTFFEREASYLIDAEWARCPNDILERRTKHGLHLSQSERQGFEDWMAGRAR